MHESLQHYEFKKICRKDATNFFFAVQLECRAYDISYI